MGKNSPEMNELDRELFETCRNFLWNQKLAENEPSEVERVFCFLPENPQEPQDSEYLNPGAPVDFPVKN